MSHQETICQNIKTITDGGRQQSQAASRFLPVGPRAASEESEESDVINVVMVINLINVINVINVINFINAINVINNVINDINVIKISDVKLTRLRGPGVSSCHVGWRYTPTILYSCSVRNRH